MIQLYYISTPEREHRFDAVFTQLDAVATFFPAVSIPSLVAFVTRDKTVNQQSYIVCDLGVADWSDEHILSAVQLLRRFSVVKMIFLAPPGDRTTTLFKRLAEQRIDGLILDQEDPSGLLAASLQGDNGYMHRLSAIQQAVAGAAEQKVSPLHIPPGLIIDVAVCGAMPRVGVTTQAFGLYHYLSKVGFRPCILDQEQPALKMLMDLYRDRSVELDGYKEINGIRFTRERSSAFDAYILDYGTVTPEWIKPICAADLTVFVGGVKPWELPALAAGHNMLKASKPNELVTLISFSAPEDMETVKQYLDNCIAVAYHPDIWMPGSDTAYHAAVLPALRRLCGKE